MDKKLKFLKIGTIICTVISCILIIFNFVLPWTIKLALLDKVNSSDASAIGIIGGADGPTAIYITVGNRNAGYIFTGVFVVITLAGILLYRKLKNKVH